MSEVILTPEEKDSLETLCEDYNTACEEATSYDNKKKALNTYIKQTMSDYGITKFVSSKGISLSVSSRPNVSWNEGFSEEVIAALRLLTHDKDTEYMDYIHNICTSGNMTAIRVKMNDLKHNLARGKEGGYTRCVERHTLALAHIESYIAGMQ